MVMLIVLSMVCIGISSAQIKLVTVDKPLGDCRVRFNVTEEEFRNLNQRLLDFVCDNDKCFLTISIKYKIANQDEIRQSKLIKFSFSEPQNTSDLKSIIEKEMNNLLIGEEGREFEPFPIGNCTGMRGSGSSTADTRGFEFQEMHVIGFYKNNKNLLIIYSKFNEAKVKDILGSLQIIYP
jgi:hypothetical protein